MWAARTEFPTKRTVGTVGVGEGRITLQRRKMTNTLQPGDQG